MGGDARRHRTRGKATGMTDTNSTLKIREVTTG
jgi:hypothetical protein